MSLGDAFALGAILGVRELRRPEAGCQRDVLERHPAQRSLSCRAHPDCRRLPRWSRKRTTRDCVCDFGSGTPSRRNSSPSRPPPCCAVEQPLRRPGDGCFRISPKRQARREGASRYFHEKPSGDGAVPGHDCRDPHGFGDFAPRLQDDPRRIRLCGRRMPGASMRMSRDTSPGMLLHGMVIERRPSSGLSMRRGHGRVTA